MSSTKDRFIRIRAAWTPWDTAAAALLLLLTLLLASVRTSLYPLPPDSYYHLMAAQRILEDGRIPLWDWWQYAPVGRPHLYPPVFHLILAGFGWTHGDLLEGFRTVQVLFLPFVHGAAWFFVRCHWGPRWALAALALLGMDVPSLVLGIMAVPSILAGAFVLLAAAALTKQRLWLTAVLTALALYTHLGVGPLGALGLLLFAWWNGGNRWPALAAMTCALIAAAPWYFRLWIHREYLGHPIDMGVYGHEPGWEAAIARFTWLQFINIPILILAAAGLWRADWKAPHTRMAVALLVAFLPLLFSYGGRYYSQTVPIWSLFAAGAVLRIIPETFSRNTLLRVTGIAICPTVVLLGPGTVLSPGVYPMASGWLIPIVAAAGGLEWTQGGARFGYVSFEAGKELAGHLREATMPGQVVYFSEDRDFAVMVGFLANRPINRGAWEEVRPPGEALETVEQHFLSDPNGYYVSHNESDLPQDVARSRVGEFVVGWRP